MTPARAGTRLGPYEILSSLGAGGMGEVFRARDTRLNREVAIKVSREQFSERSEREARAVAALNHPNICTLHDVGPNYLVMELVEGPTLADRIKEGPVPLEEALAIARQIAEALEAAHEKGIVHRDLKPANIKLRPNGSVKVLDFGLAKQPVEQTEFTADSPTMLSGTGMILGTAGYMAPEQAKGKPVDKRADIFAFGVVLYEMVTGQRLFAGETISDALASIIKDEPDWKPVPARLRRLLRKCLEKDPNKRLRDIGDWTLLLENDSWPEKMSLWPRITILSTAVTTLAAVLFAFLYFRITLAPKPVAALASVAINVAPAEMLGPAEFYNRPSRTAIAISPDGATIVFAGTRNHTSMLYRRPLAEAAATAIPGTEGAQYPFFSPDSKWIGFAADNKLKKIALNGAAAIDVCGFAGLLWGAAWSRGGVIAFSTGAPSGLFTVEDSGGAAVPLIHETGLLRFTSPSFLPDGNTVLFTVRPSVSWEDAHVESISIDGKHRKQLLENGADARYLPSGYLLFMRSAALIAVPFDAARQRIFGSPVPVVSGIMQSINEGNFVLETGMGQYAVSETGTLVYAAGGINPTPATSLVLVGRNGGETKLAEVRGGVYGLRSEPDGARVVGMKANDGSAQSDLWTWEVPSGIATRLTSSGDATWPLFSSDGKWIFYARGSGRQSGIYKIAANGVGTPQRVLEGEDGVAAESFSPDGKWLLMRRGRSLFLHSMENTVPDKQIGPSNARLRDACFSPEGRRLAYTSDESGANEVYIQAFSASGDRHRISTNGGSNPAWSRDGLELFYLEPSNQMIVTMAVRIDSAGTRAGPPRKLFQGPYAVTLPVRSYDITPDGRFMMARRAGDFPDERVTQLRVVLGWGEELKQRVPSSTPWR